MTDLWSKADLHIHSQHSDGAHDIPTILAHVATHTDLRVIAITDHDCISGALEARALAPRYGLKWSSARRSAPTVAICWPSLFRTSALGAVDPRDGGCGPRTGRHRRPGHPCDRICITAPLRHRPRPTLDDWRSSAWTLEGINGCQLDPLANPAARPWPGGCAWLHRAQRRPTTRVIAWPTPCSAAAAPETCAGTAGTATIASGRAGAARVRAWVLESMLLRGLAFAARPGGHAQAGGIG